MMSSVRKFILSVAFIAAFVLYVFTRKGPPESVTPIAVVPQTRTVSSASAASVPKPKSISSARAQTARYRDGSYNGKKVSSYYGDVQVAVTISVGRISDVTFLAYPQDRGTSKAVSGRAMPILRSEAIAAQNAPVDIVSGATELSGAFNKSFASALSAARN